MRNIVAAVVCLVLFATVANASDIRFYESATNAITAVPPEYVSGTDLVTTPGTTTYLWAAVHWVNEDPGDDVWNGVFLNLTTPNAGVMYNPAFMGIKRWETSSDFDPTGNGDIGLVGVNAQGLGWMYDSKFYYDAPNLMKHYLVGELRYDTAVGGVAAHITTGVARRGSGPGLDTVYFGFGHPGVPNDSTGGNVYFYVPEPASMLLLGLAGLFLRRR